MDLSKVHSLQKSETPVKFAHVFTSISSATHTKCFKIIKTLKCTYVFVIFHITCVGLMWPSSGVLNCLAKFLHGYKFSLTLSLILLFNLKFWSIISLLSTACVGDWYISFCCVVWRCCGKIIIALTFLQRPESIICHR